MKRIFVLVLIAFATLNLTGNVVGVFANKDNEKFKDIYERKVPQTFHYKYDYDELYQFLNISEKEYRSEWNNGKTISEIAEKRDIYPQQLIFYLAEKQFEALDKALNNGEIDRYFYYDYAISYMKNDIIEFIDRNPNKLGLK
ncbi:hypothetical protein [Lysinibacillus sp. NPDC056232]|uniref:hypothetical protein n=1 Tax=Lysinibacillus sp. NPDC056232 TaxID=3345756 RepID=UPI0035DDF964